MVTKNDTSNADLVLTAERADSLCKALTPIADKGGEISQQLVTRGFGAHIVWQEFMESFAADESERAAHRKYALETAKNVIGRPWPMGKIRPSPQYFESDYIKQLVQARDRVNGAPESELSARYSDGEAYWRRMLDAADRRRARVMLSDRRAYDLRLRGAEQSAAELLKSEVERFATGLSSSFGNDVDDRLPFYTEAMRVHGSVHGFARDTVKSKRNAPIFSKSITNEWDLCWSLEQRATFIGSPRYGLFAPDLQLRGHNLSGSSDRAPVDTYLTFRYAWLVPEFNRAYHVFADLDTLETLVLAHLFLFSLIAPTREAAIRRSFLN